MGYGRQQVLDLEKTLRRIPTVAVIDATPVDLARLVDVGYEFREHGERFMLRTIVSSAVRPCRIRHH